MDEVFRRMEVDTLMLPKFLHKDAPHTIFERCRALGNPNIKFIDGVVTCFTLKFSNFLVIILQNICVNTCFRTSSFMLKMMLEDRCLKRLPLRETWNRPLSWDAYLG